MGRKKNHLQEYLIFDIQNIKTMIPHTFFIGTFFSIGILFCQHFYIQYIQYMSRPSSGNQQASRQQQPAISII